MGTSGGNKVEINVNARVEVRPAGAAGYRKEEERTVPMGIVL